MTTEPDPMNSSRPSDEAAAPMAQDQPDEAAAADPVDQPVAQDQPDEPDSADQPDVTDQADRPASQDLVDEPDPADQPAPQDPANQPDSVTQSEASPSGGTGGPPPPPAGFGRPSQQPPAVRLRRSATDKVLTGVCGGLGRHTGVDPILFRIGFVALVFAGGVGVLLYIALAVLMPRDDGQQIWSRAGGLPRFLPEPGAPDIRIGDREREETVAYLGAALREGRLDLTEYDERIAVAYQAKSASEIRDLVADLQLVSPDHPGSAYGSPSRPPPPKGPRSPVPRVTLAILLIGLGIVALGDRYGDWSLDPSTYFGIAVAAIGVALLVSAFGPWRRGKAALITLGLILSVGLFVTSAVEDRGGFGEESFGERTYRPTSADEIRDTYQVVMGQTILDLSAVEFSTDDPTEIQIDVTMGNFELLLPADIDVALNGEANFGSVSVFGDRNVIDGYYPGFGAGPDSGDDDPELVLDIDVRFGNAEVTRVR